MKEIIIADDSSLARMFTTRCLSAAGYSGFTVEEAKDGQEVYALMSEKVYDLIISDLNMPEMDGVELMERLVATQGNNIPPVIIITSAGNESQRARLTDLGVRAILSKPVSPSDLRDAIGGILDLDGGDYA